MKNLKHVLFGTLAVLAVLILTGCWEKDNPVRTSLNVDTSTLTLAVGESATRTATTKAQWDYQITYSSSNPAVATVDQTGKVTAKSEGEAVITVSMAETIKSWYAAATQSYNVVVKKLSITGIDGINAANGYSGHLTAPDGVTVTWSSSDPGILAVDANGNVSLVAYPATATDVIITATSSSNPAVSDSKVISVNADPGVALANATVGMIITSKGKAYTPGNYNASCGEKVAIVAYKGAAGTADYSTITDASGYVGLAIALTDANDGALCQWSTEDTGPCITVGLGGDVTTAIGTTGELGKGIDNTNRLVNKDCGYAHDHAAAQVAKDYKYDASVTAGAHPTGTSQWFLPTVYQWNLILKSMCGDHGDLTMTGNYYYTTDNFNKKIIAAGGTGVRASSYWSSVLKNAPAGPWHMFFTAGRLGSPAATATRYVRAVLAF